MALEPVAKIRNRDLSVIDTHQLSSLDALVLVAGLGSHGGWKLGTHDVPLDGRIAIVARVQTCGPFALLLTQTDEPLWYLAR